MTDVRDHIRNGREELVAAVRDLRDARRDLLLHDVTHRGVCRHTVAAHADRLADIVDRLSIDGVRGHLARADGAASLGAQLDRLDCEDVAS